MLTQSTSPIAMHQESVTVKLLDYIPPACQRPRLGKNGNAYSPSSKPEESLAWMIRAQLSHQPDTPTLPFKQPCGVYIELVFTDHPPRADIDNIAKFVLDALQKAGVYSNDKLVHSLSIYYVFAKNLPISTTILVAQKE